MGTGKGYPGTMNINQNTVTLSKVLCECLCNFNLKYVLVLNIMGFLFTGPNNLCYLTCQPLCLLTKKLELYEDFLLKES